MDAEERFLQKRLVYIKCCFHMRHGTPQASISLNRFSKHVSVDGQIVVTTRQSSSFKYHKYQDIELEVEEHMENGWQKKLVATTVSSRDVREEEKTMNS